MSTASNLLLHADDVIVALPLSEQIVAACCDFNVHPNVITTLALAFTLLIPVFHAQSRADLVVACILVRQLMDLFDGSVARTCKKTSKFGKHYDTVTDLIFWAIIGHVFSSMFLPRRAYVIFIVGWAAFMVYLYCYVTDDASAYKEYHGSFSHNAFAFFANSSMIVALFLSIAYTAAWSFKMR